MLPVPAAHGASALKASRAQGLYATQRHTLFPLMHTCTPCNHRNPYEKNDSIFTFDYGTRQAPTKTIRQRAYENALCLGSNGIRVDKLARGAPGSQELQDLLHDTTGDLAMRDHIASEHQGTHLIKDGRHTTCEKIQTATCNLAPGNLATCNLQL